MRGMQTGEARLSGKAEKLPSQRHVHRPGDAVPHPKPKLRDAWPQVWRLMRPRRWLLALGFVLMVINRLCGLVLPASSRPFIDRVLNHRQEHLLLPLIGAILGATLIQAGTSFALTQLLSKEAQRLIADMRREVQTHIARLSVSFYDANVTGNLVSRIMSDVEGVRNLVGTGQVDFIGGIITAAIAFVVLMTISVKITLLIFITIAAFALLLQRALKVMRPIFRERGRLNAEVTGRLTESLGGVRVVKGYHAEGRESAVFSSGVQRLLDNVLQSLTMTSLLSLASTGVVGLMGALVMYLGGHAVLRNGMTAGGYVEYTMFLAFMIAPVFQVVNIGTQLTEAIAGLDRTNEIMSERQEYDEPSRVIELPPIAGDVRFDEVSFAYEPDKPVLHGISFHAEPGTVTALVGSSGSGKSTIISLICAFHTPGSGTILIDSIDLATVKLDSYRSQLGVVLQESFLFDGTIRENVMFSRPDANQERFERACAIARVDEFAERFPDGYETIVGERGVKLSGGQRQRISIARAILAEPRILILDEATSSLDSESEAMIQQGLSFLMQGRTTFVIAHRLSTIRRADQILVVEGGRIVEHGTHDALFAAGGRYYDLYTRQHGLDANRFLAPGEGDKVMEPV